MIIRMANKEVALSFSVGCGGFIYESCGYFFHVPFGCMKEAEKFGMTIAVLG